MTCKNCISHTHILHNSNSLHTNTIIRSLRIHHVYESQKAHRLFQLISHSAILRYMWRKMVLTVVKLVREKTIPTLEPAIINAITLQLHTCNLDTVTCGKDSQYRSRFKYTAAEATNTFVQFEQSSNFYIKII